MSAIAAKSPSAAFKKDVELVAGTLEMYQGEVREITKAQSSGTPEEQASALAAVANAQFNVYRTHFASQSRVTCCPAPRSRRVIDNLRRVRDRMVELRRAVSTSSTTPRTSRLSS